MFYLSLVMGGLVGFLADFWMRRFGVKDPTRIVIATVVAVLVTIFTYNGNLLHF